MKRLLVSLLVISSIASAGFALSNAFFSDTETSVGNTFAAGKVDLLIGNDSYYNSTFNDGTSFDLGNLSDNTLFFNFNDIKPSDLGEDTITLKVDDNDAWVCADLSLTANLENTCNEPELVDEPACLLDDTGELGDAVNFAFWVDDGDNVYEDNETIFASGTAAQILTQTTWALADSQSNIFPDRPLIGGQEYNIGKAWCFGDLTPEAQPQNDENHPTTHPGFTCDGSTLDNSTQTDSLEASISFFAVQSRNNPDFLCSGTTCGPEVDYTASVYDHDQGTLKNDTPITDTTRTELTNANGNPDGSFFSLGKDGFVILKFAGVVGTSGDALPDLKIHEITNGRPTYPEELASVEVSLNGTDWTPVGTASSEPGGVGGGDGITEIDLDSYTISLFQYVRLTDSTNFGPHRTDADGYDLDAVEALYGACIQES